jgi:hypothetical protein
MKRIVMTTVTKETVKMGAFEFKTGEATEVDDDAADSLLKRVYPKFEECVGEASVAEQSPKADKKATK